MMKVLLENEIQRAVADCEPSKIAVAYIGADWKTFISNIGGLEAVIVSPTVGSNPRAIIDLVKQIGWDKVNFLDELHAKTYVGKSSAIIGSANLTRNGLSGVALVELCIEVNEEEGLKKINKAFDDLKKRAQDQYPTIELKKARLIELEKIWNEATAHEIIFYDNRNKRSFADFELLGKDHFYVLWYRPVDCRYSEEVKAIQSVIMYDIHFARNDEPKPHKWVLVWRITNSSQPHGNEKPYWLYIHEIFSEGVIVEEGYEDPIYAIQREDRITPTPPFELTNEVIAAF